MTPDYIYRLSFEAINSHEAEMMELLRGKKVWSLLSSDEWEALSWHQVQREGTMDDLRAQHRTLLDWATTRKQPVRNVLLLRALAPSWEDCPASDLVAVSA